jgi:hypothetical protein
MEDGLLRIIDQLRAVTNTSAHRKCAHFLRSRLSTGIFTTFSCGAQNSILSRLFGIATEEQQVASSKTE